MSAVRAALNAAWTGVDPGPTVPELRPPVRRTWPGQSVPLPRWPDDGVGGLLDLALAADPTRTLGGVRLRRVPSAGGRYPVEAHVVIDDVAWTYDPIAHALAAPRDGAGNGVVLSLVPSRTTWRYGPRSLPVLLLDLGHALAGLAGEEIVLGGVTPVSRAEYPLATTGSVHIGQLPPLDTPEPGLVEDALAELAGLAPIPLPKAEPVAASDVFARHSAPWPLSGRIPQGVADEVLAAADGVEAVVVEPAEHPELAAALAARSCGQPEVAGCGALLLVLGEVDPTPEQALRTHVLAGMAVHRAWLRATAHGLRCRPVGCWIDVVLDLGHRRRLVHALAMGAPGLGQSIA
ncbi:hypothetical protein NLX83_10605 [Allokutzneria sp. A3M-2-11 16]|uniref:hypothetical protein n=1 Tax=Allokutzneria sp. A3M-2-11 16 TaxID=2962043 RepID=UPI0020B7ACE9|nr:hypothetical protein [Allokutzneria sp. A3M-2-11 16]MCP3799708.1 hypothetical protein [Allokutzneria sp. A3M-2-11 16]